LWSESLVRRNQSTLLLVTRSNNLRGGTPPAGLLVLGDVMDNKCGNGRSR
jgi:hypothetical protein